MRCIRSDTPASKTCVRASTSSCSCRPTPRKRHARWRPRWRTNCSRTRLLRATGSRSITTTPMPNFAVIVFPGSNCDHDAYHAAKDVLGQHAEFVWHKDTDLKGADVVILP